MVSVAPTSCGGQVIHASPMLKVRNLSEEVMVISQLAPTTWKTCARSIVQAFLSSASSSVSFNTMGTGAMGIGLAMSLGTGWTLKRVN